MMKSYAQNFEDVLLWRALNDVTNGFYVDLGAQHPVLDSVSRWFYEQGWRGVHVEPVAFYADLLRQNRPDEDVIEAVVSDARGDHVIYAFPDTGLSTMSAQIAETHKATLGREWQEQVVPSLTLSDVFARHGNREVHWLKVDVEGQERAVLASWEDNPVRPWVVLVEATYPNTQIELHAEWEALLTSRGYAFVYADGLNRYYLHEAHEDRRNRFRYPPNYFDHFSLDEHWATADLRDRNRQALQAADELRQQAEQEKAHAIARSDERDAQLTAAIADSINGQVTELATELRRQAEEEKAQAIARSDERDARLTAAIADNVNGQAAELAIKVAHDQAALELRMLTAQSEIQQDIDAKRTAENARLLAQIERMEAAVAAIQADVNKPDLELQATNEALRQLVSRMADDRSRLDEQVGALSADFRGFVQALREPKPSRWEVLRGLLRPRKEGLMKAEGVSTTAPIWRKSRIVNEAAAKPLQGPDTLTDDNTLQVMTLGQLYALPPPEFIKFSYRALLDREVDHGGLLHYLSRMALGDSRLSIHQSIAKSKEYRARAAGLDLLTLDDDAFVEAAYRRILGRASDAEGRTHYLEKIRNGTPRTDILKALAQSTEAKSSSQPALRLRREIASSLSRRWRNFGLGRSARHLAQLDFTLSTAVQRIEADFQRQFKELRAEIGKRDHGFAPSFVAEPGAAPRSTRPRWVPRALHKTVAEIPEATESDVVPMHDDYHALAQRMKQEAPFGQMRNERDGQRQFSDYLETDFAPENHNGDFVCWIGAEAVAYLRATGPRFNVQAAGFFEERSVLVSFNDVLVGTLRFNKEQSVQNLLIDDWVGKDLTIRFKCSGMFNPALAGINSDQRDLGLLIRSIYFD